MIVLSVGHAPCHATATSASSASFSDAHAPGAMNVMYRSALKGRNDGAVSSKSACTSRHAIRHQYGATHTEREGDGTCMGGLPHEHDGVQRLERREARRDRGDQRGGRPGVKRHDRQPAQRAGRQQERVERGGGVPGGDRHGHALHRPAAHEGGGETRRGEHGAKVRQARECAGGEGTGVHGVQPAEADLAEVGLGLEEAREQGFAAHRGREGAEGKGAAVEDPGEAGRDVGDREFEAEVDEMVEPLERAVEEAEKVGCQDVVGPFEVESADEWGVEVVAREGLDEPQGLLGRDINQRTVQNASDDRVEDRVDSEQRDEIAPRYVPENEF